MALDGGFAVRCQWSEMSVYECVMRISEKGKAS